MKISCCFPPVSPAVFVPLRPVLTSVLTARQAVSCCRLPFVALATSNEPSINNLVSSKLISWLLRGARTRDNVQDGRKYTKNVFKVLFLVLQPRFSSKLWSHSSSHCKKSHSGLQHINNLVLHDEGRAVISMPYRSHQINRTNYLASDRLAGHLFWQKERRLISRDESKVEPCC